MAKFAFSEQTDILLTLDPDIMLVNIVEEILQFPQEKYFNAYKAMWRV